MALDPHPPSCTFPRRVSVPFPLGAFYWSLKAFGSLVKRGLWDALCLVAAEALWPVPHLFSMGSPQTSNICKSVGVKMRVGHACRKTMEWKWRQEDIFIS